MKCFLDLSLSLMRVRPQNFISLSFCTIFPQNFERWGEDDFGEMFPRVIFWEGWQSKAQSSKPTPRSIPASRVCPKQDII